jgi:hypothetical protein
MAINFSNNQTLSEISNKISAPGRIVQTVHTVQTAGMQTASTSPVDWFTSTAITLASANNIILIEHHSDNRTNDWSDGGWNLYYMDIVHVQSGTQITYTGYVGELTYNIRHVHRVGRHQPGSVGPHSYKVRGWSYSALNTSFNGLNYGVGNDSIAYLRLTEIAV